MPEFRIGRNKYFALPKFYCVYSNRCRKIEKIVKIYDCKLHQSLNKIFREHCSSNSSSSYFEKFHYDPQHNSDWKSIIRPILEREPSLSKHFTKEQLGKLSLLWIMVLAGYHKSAELWVRSGADVKEPFGCHNPQVIDEKWTVLHVLLQMRRSPENEILVRLVTDHGADLQARDYMGRTVLHYAVENNRVQMTETLLEKGADVNAADDEGETPLLIAAGSRKAVELVPLLMKHGADIFTKDRYGANILQHLTFSRYQKHVSEVARDVIEKSLSLDNKVYLMQPIHDAAKRGNAELVKVFLDHGANVNALTKSGTSPLYLAAQATNYIVVEILLERGAKVDLRTILLCRNYTALLATCKTAASRLIPSIDCGDIIELLLLAGADVLAEDFDGNTPLALISSGENVELPGILFLIQALALKKSLQPSIQLKDERIIERHPRLLNYYQDCTDEINRMNSTKFIDTCSFFELLEKSHYQIAALMRNPEFETEFGQYDLNRFPKYAKDIRRAFERAQKRYRAMIEQENVLNEAWYNLLPYVVVRRISDMYNDC